jgi:hypothetical protein
MQHLIQVRSRVCADEKYSSPQVGKGYRYRARYRSLAYPTLAGEKHVLGGLFNQVHWMLL